MRTFRRRHLFWLVSGLLGCTIGSWPGTVANVHADTLSIRIGTTVHTDGDTLSVRVTSANRGNATAYDVHVHLYVGERQMTRALSAPLAAGQSESVRFESRVRPLRAGRYPLTVRLDFNDAQGYPFTALSVTTFHSRRDVDADLVVIARDMHLSDQANGLALDVINMAPVARQVKASLILPREMETPSPSRFLRLNAGFDERSLSFAILNRGARPGASYPVFCILEYDDNDLHCTQVERALIHIQDRVNPFRQNRLLWLTLTAVLALAPLLWSPSVSAGTGQNRVRLASEYPTGCSDQSVAICRWKR